jgi:hypothetical protein
MRQLKRFSGIETPLYTLVTDVGKVRGFEHDARPDADGYLHIETVYTPESYQEATGNHHLPLSCYIGDNGRIVTKYLDGKDE